MPNPNQKKDEGKVVEGSQAIAETIRNINPAVVSAYPITPQTHIVERLAKERADGQASYSYVRAESEFAAASIILGAAAAGQRTYSATSSQGLLLMTEVLYNIAGMRLPIVMTCANRAVSAPINIWNDQSDAMSVRDCGWIQLFAADNQEAADLHVLAYKLAEKLSLPVMVHVDGFVLTHAFEKVAIPEIGQIAAFLPPYNPAPGSYLDPANPKTLGAFATPGDYFEIRQELHNDLLSSLDDIEGEYKDLMKALGRKKQRSLEKGLYEYYGPAKPELLIVALGSVIGTIRAALKDDPSIGIIKLRAWRPFPAKALLKIIGQAKRVAVIEKAISLGQAGPLFTDIKAAGDSSLPPIRDYIVGLGGRDVTENSLKRIAKDAKKKGADINFVGSL